MAASSPTPCYQITPRKGLILLSKMSLDFLHASLWLFKRFLEYSSNLLKNHKKVKNRYV